MMRRLAHGDGGAALVMVLVLVTVVAAGLAVTLSFADTSIRTTQHLRDQAAATYNADGAMQAAVNTIRNSRYNGAVGEGCFGAAGDTLHLPEFSGTDSAAVTCTADPMQVRIACPPLSQCNRPGNAVLTTGTDLNEDGVRIDQPNNSDFRVHGVVYSHSTIRVANGDLVTDTPVYARGECFGTIKSDPDPACEYTGSYPHADDPHYPPATATVPAYRALPTCDRRASVIAFEPGYYDDAAALSSLMSDNRCAGSTWWFKPGAYYFDFHNTGPNAYGLQSSGDDHVWTVDNGRLVAGTPVDAAGATVAAPPVGVTIPGSCANPIKSANAVGVQFIFGGDSRMVISQPAQAEICGTYRVDKPPVAIHGLPSSTPAIVPTTLTGADALRLDTVDAAGNFSGATPAHLATVDGTGFASWTNPAAGKGGGGNGGNGGGGNAGGTVTVAGFHPPAIPAGSILTSAAVRLVHRHRLAGTEDVTVTLTPALTSGTAAPVTATASGAPATAGFRTDLIPVDGAAGGVLATAVHRGTLTGATIAVKAALGTAGDTEDIDAVHLELGYQKPAFRGASDCVVARPYTGGGNPNGPCAQIATSNSVGADFYVQGTTYTPDGVVDVQLNNVAEQIFRFGVVVRSLRVKLTGSFLYTGPVIEVPDDSPGFAMSVYLNAHVCPGAGPCATGGQPALSARVSFVDADPATPTAGDRQVSVLSWSSPH